MLDASLYQSSSSFWTIHSASTQKYRIPSRRVISIASKNVFESLDTKMPAMLCYLFVVVVVICRALLQQLLKAAYDFAGRWWAEEEDTPSWADSSSTSFMESTCPRTESRSKSLVGTNKVRANLHVTIHSFERNPLSFAYISPNCFVSVLEFQNLLRIVQIQMVCMIHCFLVSLRTPFSLTGMHTRINLTCYVVYFHSTNT